MELILQPDLDTASHNYFDFVVAHIDKVFTVVVGVVGLFSWELSSRIFAIVLNPTVFYHPFIHLLHFFLSNQTKDSQGCYRSLEQC